MLSLEDGLRLIAARGRLMDTMEAGEMVAVFADEATVAAAVARHADDVGVAAVNGPTTTVVSGRPAAVAAVIAELGLGDDELRRLDVSIAAHSPLVAPIVPAFADALSGVRLARPALGLVSSMTGRFADDELTDPSYWRAHLRRPVRFADVFATLRERGVQHVRGDRRAADAARPRAAQLVHRRGDVGAVAAPRRPRRGPAGDERRHLVRGWRRPRLGGAR